MIAIDELMALENHDDAESPNRLAASNAHGTLERLASLRTPSGIIASPDGGVFIFWISAKGRQANIECFNTGEILGAMSGPDENCIVWTVDDIQVTQEKIAAWIA